MDMAVDEAATLPLVVYILLGVSSIIGVLHSTHSTRRATTGHMHSMMSPLATAVVAVALLHPTTNSRIDVDEVTNPKVSAGITMKQHTMADQWDIGRKIVRVSPVRRRVLLTHLRGIETTESRIG